MREGRRGAQLAANLRGMGWRVAVTAGFFTLFFVLYFAVGSLTASPPLHSLVLSLDRRIPFVPGAVWIYLLAFPAIAAPFLAVRETRAFRLMLLTYGAVTFVAMSCFLLFPLTSEALRATAGVLEPRGGSRWAVALLYRIDPPRNLCPSLHVALMTVAASAVGRISRSWGVGFFFGTAMVATAACAIKQHSLLDVIAGGVLGGVAARILTCRLRGLAS